MVAFPFAGSELLTAAAAAAEPTSRLLVITDLSIIVIIINIFLYNNNNNDSGEGLFLSKHTCAKRNQNTKMSHPTTSTDLFPEAADSVGSIFLTTLGGGESDEEEHEDDDNWSATAEMGRDSGTVLSVLDLERREIESLRRKDKNMLSKVEKRRFELLKRCARVVWRLNTLSCICLLSPPLPSLTS